jgi:hypothetical protein
VSGLTLTDDVGLGFFLGDEHGVDASLAADLRVVL